MKPIIGITCGVGAWDFPNIRMKGQVWFYVSRKYIEVIREAGGVPLILPFQDASIVENLEGLLLTGGYDIDPIHFNEAPEGVGSIDPERDSFEIALMKEALKRKIPILGICRGVQLINVACGGTLLQDIGKDHLKHSQEAPNFYPTHGVKLWGRLKEIYGEEEIPVNSFHHQAIKKLARGFSACAKAKDGIVEGISLGHVMGVQWHPEWMTEEYPIQKRLFESFITYTKS